MRARGDAAISTGLVLLAIFFIAGCQPVSTENNLLLDSGMTAEDPPFYPSDDFVRNGKIYFRNGDYGLAEQNFRKAVEVTPTDLEAWLGLAASYDQLRRFDLADKSYREVLKIGARNPIVLNNVGYSYLLRGDTRKARELLLRAYELDPENPNIVNNLELLGETSRTVKRPNVDVN